MAIENLPVRPNKGAPLLHARTCASTPDLAPYPDAPVQWWFVQGELDRPGDLQSRFMVALFRAVAAPDAPPGHMLLLHLLNCGGLQSEKRSRITPDVPEFVRQMALSLATAHLPAAPARILAGLHIRRAEASAQRDGVEIIGGPELGSEGLALDWDGIALAQQGNDIHLRFPMNDGVAELVLVPQRPWLDERSEHLCAGFNASYAYQCCSRLAVRGTVGGKEVSGRAWMDRQWGPVEGWLLPRTDAGLQPLGWDWFGLSFDSDEDLLIMRHFLPGDPNRCGNFAILFDRAGAIQVGNGLEAQTLRTWQSPQSGIVYPVQQRLRLPALDAEFEVVPIADNQEIPVFGLPAIWQGAIDVTGRIGPRRLSGSGRLELFGYGYAPSIQAYLARAAGRARRPL